MANTTVVIQNDLVQLKAGDAGEREMIAGRSLVRFINLAERMHSDLPTVSRWEDVVQCSVMRLHQSLEKVVPSTHVDYFREAALQIRRELLNLARHYSDPEGMGRHESQWIEPNANAERDRNSDTNDSKKLAIWQEIHGAVDHLPEMERSVFELVWYHDLTQVEVADLLQIGDRQVRRYWNSARLILRKCIGSSDQMW